MPLFKQTKNDPYNVNEHQQKKSFNSTIDSKSKSGNEFLNLQIMMPPQPKEKSQQTIISTYPNSYNNYNQIVPGVIGPIVKNYNINATPTNDHTLVNAIYEDVLPVKNINDTFQTIGERCNLYEFIRSKFINRYDGEDVELNGQSAMSLTRLLKYLQINPYNTNKLSNNPYQNLPDNMLIYSTCYPIKLNTMSNNTECSPNSIGLNVKIYKMNEDEFANKQNIKYNIWRELAYNEYIREFIVKKLISPNFAQMYCYFVEQKCTIDFDKLLHIKKSNINTNININNNDNPFGCKCRGICVCRNTIFGCIGNCIGTCTCNNNIIQNQLRNKNRALITLNEAPTYSFIQFTMKTYYQAPLSNVLQPKVDGIYKPDVWYSILFQLISALYVMQMNNIAFKNFTLDDNVYIKSISLGDEVATLYWKYIINNIEYYVPNKGYLVLIDSNYKDVQNNNTTMPLFNNTTQCDNHKIIAEIFNDDNTLIHNTCFNQFLNCFNPNKFSLSYVNNNCVKPPQCILDFMQKIYTEANITQANKNINYYILKYFKFYLNNRIGTYLTNAERSNVRNDDDKNFINGSLVVYEETADMYQFALFEQFIDTNTAQIIVKNKQTDTEYITKIVSITNIINYKYDLIQQTYDPNKINLNELNLIETYIQK